MNKDKIINIGFNSSILVNRLTGIGRYVNTLLNHFNKYEFLKIVNFNGCNWNNNIIKSDFNNLNNLNNFNFIISNLRKVIPYSYTIKKNIQQYFFSQGLKKIAIDIYHEPNYLSFKYNGPTILNVHDLSWISFPQTHPKERVKILNENFESSLRNAEKIITDSLFIKNEIISQFGIKKDKIHSIELGVEDYFRPISKLDSFYLLNKYNLSYKNYWIYLGTIEPRKNIELIIDAFMKLPKFIRVSNPLVIVGMYGWNSKALYTKINKLLKFGEIIYLSYVKNSELPILLSGARALIYPSLYEGFGLPTLEAMSCGAPVICSNVTSLPEVVGQAGLYFHPSDVDKLNEYMLNLFDDEKYCNLLSERSILRSKNFTWDKCAKETIKIYRLVLN